MPLKDILEQMDIKKHTQNIPFKTNRICILFKYTWNILQNRYLLGYKTNFNTFKKIEIIPCIFSQPQKYESRNISQGKKMEKTQTHADWTT